MATATQSKTTTSSPTFEIPSIEQATERIRDLNERIIESSKTAGLVTLDAYEKALTSLAEFEEKVASATQLDWVSALATTHAKFITDVSTSYTKAARDLLK
jgi:hypothetical protein